MRHSMQGRRQPLNGHAGFDEMADRWRLGSLLAFTPAANFKLISGQGAMTEFQFNKQVIHHLFCSTCGIQSFARGKRPDGAEMIAINVRCVDGIDPDKLTVKKVDGRSF